VIGVADEIKGQLPVGFVLLKAGVDRPTEEIERELVAMVRDEIGAVASLRRVLVVERLPKTRSGKILRSTMRKIADDQPFEVPSTIDDPLILDEIRSALERRQGG
jgi:propionyl-CoA synthetase